MIFCSFILQSTFTSLFQPFDGETNLCKPYSFNTESEDNQILCRIYFNSTLMKNIQLNADVPSLYELQQYFELVFSDTECAEPGSVCINGTEGACLQQISSYHKRILSNSAMGYSTTVWIHPWFRINGCGTFWPLTFSIPAKSMIQVEIGVSKTNQAIFTSSSIIKIEQMVVRYFKTSTMINMMNGWVAVWQ